MNTRYTPGPDAHEVYVETMQATMNDQLKQFARQTLKEGLAALPESNHRIFKLMYGRGKSVRGVPARSVAEAEAMPINDVVDEIPDEKLDWAMQQVENSKRKLDKILVGTEHQSVAKSAEMRNAVAIASGPNSPTTLL